MIRVLFVCLGNICRSPLAEGHFIKLIKENNLQDKIECDSAGTGSYHIGSLADSRTRKNAESHGLTLTHRARQLKTGDFTIYDYILAMDESNLENIMYMKETLKEVKSKIFLMRHFDSINKDSDVPDPYLGGAEGFENVYQILKRSTSNFMEYLKSENNL